MLNIVFRLGDELYVNWIDDVGMYGKVAIDRHTLRAHLAGIGIEGTDNITSKSTDTSILLDAIDNNRCAIKDNNLVVSYDLKVIKLKGVFIIEQITSDEYYMSLKQTIRSAPPAVVRRESRKANPVYRRCYDLINPNRVKKTRRKGLCYATVLEN